MRSKKQAWGTAPKKGKVLHEAQFARNIKVVGVREDVSEQSVESNQMYRSEFDPCLPAHRVKKPINKFNPDWLATITNGNCGILMHTKREADPNHQVPDLNICSKEETVKTSVPVPTVLEGA